ncbi:MAG: alpha/beta hydrolase [Sphingobacteriales bacterium]|jgi:pimeloyl-ACP methyl ester carboxylesterase|nr:MAG: alpha/beta hydrolase [Sphingobacteriales bacterium]
MIKTINVQGTEVYIQGQGKDTIVMIHGWPDTHEIWAKQIEYFSPKYTCVTFTLPGFAKNDDTKYSLDTIVDRIKNIIDTVSPESKVILLVHDWGCVFGYEYVIRNPERIAKMIGIDIGDAASKDFANSLSIQAKLMVFAYQFTLAVGWLVKNDFVHKSMAKALKARSNIENIHAGMGLPYAMQWFNVAGGLKKLKVLHPKFPFFYAYAAKKPFQFHSKKWTEELLLNPKNKVQAFNSGHWVMIDKADEFNKSVDEWLK